MAQMALLVMHAIVGRLLPWTMQLYHTASTTMQSDAHRAWSEVHFILVLWAGYVDTVPRTGFGPLA